MGLIQLFLLFSFLPLNLSANNCSLREMVSKALEIESKMPKEESQNLIPLNQAEANALKSYTSNSYTEINTSLRRKHGDLSKLNKNQKKSIEQIDQAMKKIPAYIGVSFRAGGISGAQNALVGNTYSDFAFLSTGLSAENIQKDFISAQTPVFYIVIGKSGRDISRYSQYPNEKEILFPRETKFEVLERCKDDSKRLKLEIIKIREVERL